MTKFVRLQGSDYSQYQYIWGRCMQLLLAGDMKKTQEATRLIKFDHH